MHSLVRLSLVTCLAFATFAQTSGQPITLTYDFRAGAQGWTALFADYPAGEETFYELQSGIAALPPDLGISGTGFLISGNNHSDDLLMALKRQVGSAQGVVAGRTYWLDYVVEFASNAQTGCVGVGGPPGEGVYIKVGGSPVEPTSVTRAQDSYRHLSVNVGNQSMEGPAATLAGNVANGAPCGSEPQRYRLVTRAKRHRFPVTADNAGNLWLLVLSDSGFEATTRLYYTKISVTLTPVETGGATIFANLSSRAATGGVAGPVVAGFYIAGNTSRSILVRGAGPGLAKFGVSDFLADPTLELLDADAQRVAYNDNWSDSAALPEVRAAIARTGAFAFDENSKDAALVANLAPGLYSAVLRSGASASGVSLVEIYDAGSRTEPARLVNLSTRAWVAAGEGALFPGLVIVGPNPEKVLIRAVGPGLAAFGVNNFLPDPMLQLFEGSTSVAGNDNWNALADGALAATAAQAVGAFALVPGSKDAALTLTLAPGAYTLRVSDSNAGAGVALIEVYRVP